MPSHVLGLCRELGTVSLLHPHILLPMAPTEMQPNGGKYAGESPGQHKDTETC